MPEVISQEAVEQAPDARACAYRILRYAPNLVRDEWVNIGVLVFDPATGERRLRLIEEAAGSRGAIRGYCNQVWRQARLWERITKLIRVDEFTFPGDPMKLDYGYRRNGARGFVQALSVARAPGDAKLLAYTAERVRGKIPASEFTAVTDTALAAENERHRFVRETLRDAGIETVPQEGFAVWVAKLKPMLQ